MSGSPFHGESNGLLKFDPRILILLTVVFVMVCVMNSSLQTLSLLLLFSICLAVLLWVDFWRLIKTMVLVDGFMVLALFTLPFTMADVGPAAATPQIFGLSFSWAGVWLAVGIALKTNAIIICSAALLGRLSMAEFSHALAHLYVPSLFVQILLLMVRYVDVLGDEVQRLRVAMKCRGFRMRSSWHCWKSLGFLIGMTFLRSFERGEQIMTAMKCRGFRGTFPLLHHFHASWRDGVFVLFFVSALAAIVGFETYYGGAI